MTSGQKAAVPQQPLRPNSARLQASAPGSGATPSLLGRRLQRYRACAPEAPQPAPAPRLRRAAHVGVAERRAATRQRSRLCGLGNHFGRSAVDGGIRCPVIRPRRRPRRRRRRADRPVVLLRRRLRARIGAAAHQPRRHQPGRHVRPHSHRRASDGPLGRAARSRSRTRARARSRAGGGGRPDWRGWRSVGRLAGGQGQVRPGEIVARSRTR